MSKNLAQEIRLHGIGVSPGISRGVALVLNDEDEEPPIYKISEDEIDGELARLESALLATREQILEMQERIAGAIGAKDAGIFDAHVLVVEDRMLLDEVAKMLREERYNIEYIFHRVALRYARSLSEIDDAYLRERALDIQDVTRRVIRNLTGKSLRRLGEMDKPHILIAHDITPSDTATMNRELVLGFATDIGSRTSHTAIMAASLNLPAVVGLHTVTDKVSTGDALLLDGYAGLLIIHPSEETLAEYGAIESRKGEVEKRLTDLREQQPVTTDGRHIMLSANIEIVSEVEAVARCGAEGVGLFRTEFLYLNRSTPPDEETQFRAYRTVVEAVAPHGAIIRTLDVGGDKIAGSLEEDGDEANPFLGWRAIRFCLERPDIFKPQIRAILRSGVHGRTLCMFPMISSLGELLQSKALVEECKEELRSEGRDFDERLTLGAMIEVPSAALIADQLAAEVDFFSIGTNDLIQYTIAVDRLNERIAKLYMPTHPAILRLIRQVCDAAHAQGKWVGVCGEMAGDILFTPLLLGLGIDELSAGAALVPRVKHAIRSLNMDTCLRLAEESLSLDDPARIHQLCRDVAQTHYPDML